MKFDMNEIVRLQGVEKEKDRLKQDVENTLLMYEPIINKTLRETKIGSRYAPILHSRLNGELIRLLNGEGYSLDLQRSYSCVTEVLSSNHIECFTKQGNLNDNKINSIDIRINIDDLIKSACQ